MNGEGFHIAKGAEYLYQSDFPRGRKGNRYLVEDFITDVPVYVEKVLVLCLTGPDAGMRFCVTPMNFAQRYAPLPMGEESVRERSAIVVGAYETPEGREEHAG